MIPPDWPECLGYAFAMVGLTADFDQPGFDPMFVAERPSEWMYPYDVKPYTIVDGW